MPNSNLQRDRLCTDCVGCYKVKNKNFTGRYNCRYYQPVIKRVWCADEVIKRFVVTGKIR